MGACGGGVGGPTFLSDRGTRVLWVMCNNGLDRSGTDRLQAGKMRVMG